jgi:hypothetical protein
MLKVLFQLKADKIVFGFRQTKSVFIYLFFDFISFFNIVTSRDVVFLVFY